jgi:ATP synthase protein I
LTDSASVPEDLRTRTRRLISWQIVTGLVVVTAYYLGRGPWEALSAAYGGGLSLALALLLSLSVTIAGQIAARNPGQGQLILYGAAALRFVLVLALFAIGIAVIGLAPIAMVAGFAAVQLVFVLAAGRQ